MRSANQNLKFFLFYFFLLIQSSILISSAVAIVKTNAFYPDERDALLQLRDSVTSNLDLHSNWTGPPCHESAARWIGISCLNGHVVIIVLEGIELKGSLPSTFLQNITYLTKVSFSNNSLSGHLPNLTNLVHLHNVSLSQNTIWGTIPLEFTQLPRLQTLELQQNYLYGEIPPFDQPTLTVFNVSYNHLGGAIPSTSVLQKFPSTSFDNNSGLCGKPLDVPCNSSISPSPLPSHPPPPLLPPPPGAVPPPVSPPPPPGEKKKGRLRPRTLVLIAIAAGLVPFLVILGFLGYSRGVHRKETRKDIGSGMT